MLAIFTFKPALGPLFLLSTLAIYCAFKPQNQLGPPFLVYVVLFPLNSIGAPFWNLRTPFLSFKPHWFFFLVYVCVFFLQPPIGTPFVRLQFPLFGPKPYWDPLSYLAYLGVSPLKSPQVLVLMCVCVRVCFHSQIPTDAAFLNLCFPFFRPSPTETPCSSLCFPFSFGPHWDPFCLTLQPSLQPPTPKSTKT